MYVRTNDIDAATGKLKAGAPVEPLVLRANAGECIEVTLFNKLPANVPDLAGWNTLPMIVEGFNANQVKPSNQVGLHPQLVAYDVVSSDGANAGFNLVGNPESYTPDGRQTAVVLPVRQRTVGHLPRHSITAISHKRRRRHEDFSSVPFVLFGGFGPIVRHLKTAA
jgi:hypothetical protein